MIPTRGVLVLAVSGSGVSGWGAALFLWGGGGGLLLGGAVVVEGAQVVG